MFVLIEIKSWVLSGAYCVVVGPLVRNRMDDEVFKEIFWELVGDNMLTGENKVRSTSTPSKTKTFDIIMGFPG